jgi:hypothetical protein
MLIAQGETADIDKDMYNCVYITCMHIEKGLQTKKYKNGQLIIRNPGVNGVWKDKI